MACMAVSQQSLGLVAVMEAGGPVETPHFQCTWVDQNLYHSGSLDPAASPSCKNMLERQIFGFHPRPSESDTPSGAQQSVF